MKVLNLDKLSRQPSRELAINGEKHPIHPLSVEGFIEVNRLVDKLNQEGASIADQAEAAVDMIRLCVPTLERGVLLKYQPDVLNTIANFVRGDDVPEQEEEAEGK